MAINLTLNDFRNVLGKVNDGNVVFKKDAMGTDPTKGLIYSGFAGSVPQKPQVS